MPGDCLLLLMFLFAGSPEPIAAVSYAPTPAGLNESTPRQSPGRSAQGGLQQVGPMQGYRVPLPPIISAPRQPQASDQDDEDYEDLEELKPTRVVDANGLVKDDENEEGSDASSSRIADNGETHHKELPLLTDGATPDGALLPGGSPFHAESQEPQLTIELEDEEFGHLELPEPYIDHENHVETFVEVGVSEMMPAVGILTAPLREATLLLPKRFDPYMEAVTPSKANFERVRARPVDGDVFRSSKKGSLLAAKLATNVDPTVNDVDWNYQIHAGGNFRQGNTNTTNVQGGVRGERRSDRSTLTMKLDGNYFSDGKSSQNQQATGSILFDRNLRGRWLTFVQQQDLYDRAALIDLRTVSSMGLGFRFLDMDDTRLIVRTGPTFSYMLYAPEAENDDESRSGWLLEGEYRHLIGDSTRVEVNSTAYPDFDSDQQIRVTTEAGLVFPIGGHKSHWNWKVGFQHIYQMNPVDDTKPSDFGGSFSILYAN